MKRFNRNEIRANVGESNIRPQLKGKSAQRHYTRAGAAIFAIIILHFVSQFIFFQDEKISPRTEAINHRSVEIEPAIQPQSEPIAEFKTEPVAKKPLPAKMPKAVAPPVVQPERKPAPSRAIVRKKETRESRAERLRRAEKLLTGV